MINNSPFDDHIKKRLGNYEPEVPPHIWENIMAGKEKRRPGGLLFYLTGNRLTIILLMLVLSAGGAFLVHNIKNTNPGNAASNNETSVSDNTNTKDKNNNIVRNVNTESQIETTKKDDKINNNTAEPASQNNTAAAQTNNTTINDSRIIKTVDNSNNQAKPGSLLATSSSHKDVKKKNEPLSRYYNPDADPASGDQSTSVRNKAKNTATRTRMTIDNANSETASTTNNITNDAAESSIYNKDLSLGKYYLQLNLLRAEKTFAFSVKALNLPGMNIPCPGPEKNAAGNKRYFEIYGGPDYVFRSFSDTANSTYLQKRKESTSFSSAFSVGLRYTRVFNNAVSFRTGINYSQVNEKFKFETGHMVQLVYILDGNGDTTGSYATTGSRYKTTHNKYRTLDVPLIFGYEMGNGRFHTNINAGLIVNLYSWQKGDLLDNEYQPINITTGKSSSPYQFKTNVGIGFTAGASLYYKLTDNLHVLAEPYFRYNFSPANKSEITLKQKYTTLGLRLGLRIDF